MKKKQNYSTDIAENTEVENEIIQSIMESLPALSKLVGGDAALTDHEGIPLLSYNYEGEINYDILGKQSLQAKEALEHGKFQLSWSNRIPGAQAIRIPLGKRYLLGINNEAITDKYAHMITRELYETSKTYSISDIIGVSPAVNEIKRQVRLAAAKDTPVLISGESGLNKEVFAGVIHNHYGRENSIFLTLKCAAIPKALFGRIFFGTMAQNKTDSDEPGVFETAKDGTIFLRRIDQLDYKTQIQLSEVLRQGNYYKLGGKSPIPIRCRIIASCDDNPERLIREGKLYSGLYWQCAVHTINIPPLRYRREDIPHYLNYFIAQHNRRFGAYAKGIDEDVMEILQEYRWPGNICEMQNCVERMYNSLQANIIIEKKHIPEYIVEAVKSSAAKEALSSQKSLNVLLKNYEKEIIEAALIRNQWSRSMTASELNIDPATLWRKMTALNIKAP